MSTKTFEDLQRRENTSGSTHHQIDEPPASPWGQVSMTHSKYIQEVRSEKETSSMFKSLNDDLKVALLPTEGPATSQT